MRNSELKKLASQIKSLELKCQKGENVSNNLKEIEQIAEKLTLEDLIKIDEMISCTDLTF
jgi:hypothetical protein